jgi:hypothetical protein
MKRPPYTKEELEQIDRDFDSQENRRKAVMRGSLRYLARKFDEYAKHLESPDCHTHLLERLIDKRMERFYEQLCRANTKPNDN